MTRIDILRWPLIGRFLGWRFARPAMQLPVLILAGMMIFDGLFGPQLAPKNLATVGVWLHYRGLVVLALLFAGNLFCMACPFMLPREGARWLRTRLLGGGRALPAPLRSKWLAVALVVIFFFLYERFDLWATPWWTAWVAIAYFATAFVVDLFFRGAAFCKYVCPLGQFNFFGSLISPLEVRVLDHAGCAACRTKDCITAGTPAIIAADALGTDVTALTGRSPLPAVRGCELWLFQQRKAGNMDCTFCLDCIHACPYDNIGIIGRVPTSDLWTDPFRSGVGRFSGRTDLAVLVSVFIFGAYLNAFAMISPVYSLQDRLAQALGASSETPGLILLFVLGLVVIPALLLGGAGLASRALAGGDDGLARTIRRYVYTLVPMGFGMWLAHYSFHFLTGGLTIVPVVQSFLSDTGLWRGDPAWGIGPLVPQGWLFAVEAALLYLGAFGSIITAFMIAEGRSGRGRRGAIREGIPWMVAALLLLALGLWILVQPMEMRGTMLMVGG